MSETWTPASSGSESWTATTAGAHVFSPLVFSHASHTGKRVFSMKSADGNTETWDVASGTAESWTAA